MNFFYDLPEEIIDKIYKLEHRILFNKTIDEINYLKRNEDFDTFIYKLLFSSDMSNKEVNDFHIFCVWVDDVLKNSSEEFPHPVEVFTIQNSKYISHYINFWNDTVNWDDEYTIVD